MVELQLPKLLVHLASLPSPGTPILCAIPGSLPTVCIAARPSLVTSHVHGVDWPDGSPDHCDSGKAGSGSAGSAARFGGLFRRAGGGIVVEPVAELLGALAAAAGKGA